MVGHALHYLKKGFPVIPVRGPAYSNGDPEKAKLPLIRWAEFQKRLPTEAEVRQWFAKWPKANIGVVTGKISGIVVVDFDSQDAVAMAKAGGILDTPLVETGRGLHAYYRFPKEGNIRNSANVELKTDIRGEGGYAVIPPSIHPSGRSYMWAEDHGLDDLEIGDLPGIFLEFVQKESQKEGVNGLYKGVAEGGRNNALARLCGSWVNDGLTLDECMENAAIWNQKNSPPLPSDEVERTVRSILNKHRLSPAPKRPLVYHEKNLLKFPIFTHDMAMVYKKEKIVAKFTIDGMEREWTVLSNVGYGLAGPFDESVFLAINKIVSDIPKPVQNPINIGSLRSMAEMLRISPGGKSLEMIKQSIKRIQSLVIISRSAFYDSDKRKYTDDQFSIYQRTLFKGEYDEGGMAVAETNLVWLNDVYLKNVNNGYSTPIDFGSYISLKSPIARGIFKVITPIFLANNNLPIAIRYATLCKKLQIPQAGCRSRIDHQLGHAHRELLSKSFISKVEHKNNKANDPVLLYTTKS